MDGKQHTIQIVRVDSMGKKRRAGPAIYEIQVEGCLDADWSDWFEDLTITVQPAADGSPITCLTGIVEDQPALRGLLSKIWDMNLVLICVSRLGSETEKGRAS